MEVQNAAGLLILGNHQSSWWLLVGRETKKQVVGQYGTFSAKIPSGESEINKLITRFQQESQSKAVDEETLSKVLLSEKCITKDFTRLSNPPVTYRVRIAAFDASVINLPIGTHSKNPLHFSEEEVAASQGKDALTWIKLSNVIGKKNGKISTGVKLDKYTRQLLDDLRPELRSFLPGRR